MVVVRSYSWSSQGSATLRITPCSSWGCGAPVDAYIPRFAGNLVNLGERLPYGSILHTTRQLEGAINTFVLPLSSTSAAAGANDDGGLISFPQSTWQAMSLAFLYSEGNGAVVVGVPQWAPAEGLTTLVWDTRGADCDGDGLSDGLETALATYPCTR